MLSEKKKSQGQEWESSWKLVEKLQAETNKAMLETLGEEKYHPLYFTSQGNMVKREFSVPTPLLSSTTSYSMCQRYLAVWTDSTVIIYSLHVAKERHTPFGAKPGVNHSLVTSRYTMGEEDRLSQFMKFEVEGKIKAKNGVTFDNSEQSIIIITDEFIQRAAIETSSITALGLCPHQFTGEVHAVKAWSFEQDNADDEFEDAFARGVYVEYDVDYKVAYFNAPPLYRLYDSKAPAVDIELLPFKPQVSLGSILLKNYLTHAVENEDNNNIQLAYLFTHEKEIAKILHIRAVEDKRIYTHENFEYMLVLTLDRQKHVTITAFVGDDNPQIAHSTYRENLNNCSEIYSITHEYPVVRSVFKISPMVSGGMLLVSSPIEFIYLLTFSKFRSDCKMHKIITLPSGIRKINQLENTQGFKYILANANGGQLLVWARMNDNKYGLIYLDDDPEFTRQTIFHFSKDLRYVYCLFNDKIMRIIFEPLNKPVKLCTNALTTLNEQEERHSFPLGDNHLLNVVKDRIEVKNMFEGTATRLFLPDGWIASFRQSQEKYKDNNNTDVALYSRKDSTTKRWFVAVRCQRIDDDDDDLRSEESKKNFTASSKSATPSTIKNSISDVYFLIFIIDIIDKSRKDPPTPNLKKQEEIIKLDGGIKYENRTQFFFDGNLFGIFYTASNSVLIYDAEVEQASVAARPIKKVNMPGILMFEKEESPSKKIESVDSKSAPDVVRKKKLFIDLWCLGQIRSTGFINFGKHLVVFGKYDEEICSDKNENSIRDEEPQTRKSKKTPFLRPRLLKKSSKSKAPSLMMLEEPLIEDQIDSKVTGPDKDQLNDSFLSHDEDVIEKFKGAEVVSKVWIFSVETINRCHANNIPIDSSQADIELEIQPNQDNVKYSNTGRYLLFYGKGGYTLMYRKKLDDKSSKINYIKRRLRVKEKYSITDSKNIVFSDDDEFLAIAFCHANRTVLFDLRKDDDKRDIVMYKLTKCNRLKEFPLVFTFINNLDGKPTFLSVTDYIEEKKKNSIAYYDISKNIDNCPKLVGPTFNVPLNPVLISSILTTENKLLVSRTILVQGRSKHHRMKTIRMMIHNFAQYQLCTVQQNTLPILHTSWHA